MKRFALVAVMALVAVGLIPATAGAGTDPGTGMVTIVHDATYSANEPFPVTLCVNGDPFAGGVGQDPFVWGDVLGPVDLPAGTYTVAIYTGAIEVCEGEPAIGPQDLDVAAGDDITAAAIWTSAGPGLTVWPNDSSCVAPGEGRVTVRHGADTDGPVDVVGTVGGTETVLVPNLAEGGQAGLDVPAPLAVTDVKVTPAGDSGTTLIAVGDVTFEPGVNTVVYAGGGNDGPAGVFVDVIQLTTCETPVEPTTTTTTTAAAQPATATPAFTG